MCWFCFGVENRSIKGELRSPNHISINVSLSESTRKPSILTHHEQPNDWVQCRKGNTIFRTKQWKISHQKKFFQIIYKRLGSSKLFFQSWKQNCLIWYQMRSKSSLQRVHFNSSHGKQNGWLHSTKDCTVVLKPFQFRQRHKLRWTTLSALACTPLLPGVSTKRDCINYNNTNNILFLVRRKKRKDNIYTMGYQVYIIIIITIINYNI